VTVGTVKSTGVFSGDGDTRGYRVAPLRVEDSELSPSPEAAPPSLEESSRVVCKDSDPLCTIPMNKAPE
jgi:hypothetical protein